MSRFLRAAGIRALRTVAQAAAAMLGTSAVLSEVNWLAVGSAAVLAGILFVLLVYATMFAGKRTRWGRQTEGKKNDRWWEKELADRGLFALCRHPAVWLLFFMDIFLVIAAGMTSSVKDLQFEKQFSPNDKSPCGRSAFCNSEQYIKARSPISSRPFGSSTRSNASQYINASASIRTTLSGR